MSLTNDIYLPELSTKVVENAVRLFADRGITFRIDPRLSKIEPSSWGGFVPVEITVSNKNGSETYDSGFEIYFEAFSFGSQFKSIDTSSLDANVLEKLKNCSIVLTTRSGTSVRAGVSCSWCFAAALAEAGNGIWREGESGEFVSERFAEVLQSPFAEDLLDIAPAKHTKSKRKLSKAEKLKRMAEKTSKQDLFAGYLPYQDLLIKLPIRDFLLRCIAIDGSLDSNFTLLAIYLPLYSCPGFVSEHSFRVGWDSGKEKIMWWRPSDLPRLADSLKNSADPYLSKAKDAEEFFRMESSLRHKASFADHDELIAATCVMAGNYLDARIKLELMKFQINLSFIDPVLSQSEREVKLEKLVRIKELRNALAKGPKLARELLQQRAFKMIEELELDGIKNYFEY